MTVWSRLGEGLRRVAVAVFVACGDRRHLARAMAAYGRTFDPRRLLAHTLLNVHCNLPRYQRILPAPPEPTLESLAQTRFGTDG